LEKEAKLDVCNSNIMKTLHANCRHIVLAFNVFRWKQLCTGNSNMRFATEWAFSYSVIKAKLPVQSCFNSTLREFYII